MSLQEQNRAFCKFSHCFTDYTKELIKNKSDPEFKTTTTIDPQTKVNLLKKFKYWWEYYDNENWHYILYWRYISAAKMLVI